MKKNNTKPKSTDKVITIGIDLGTTNSEVVINRNGKPEIIKNAQQDEYTPSVFGVDKSKNKVVGRKAYEKLYKTPTEEEFGNYKAEVKRLMGSDEKVEFKRLGLNLLPEEISAEILKSLREDITRKYSEYPTLSAVITVPAHFSTLQAEATKRAGYLAGLKYVVLLQEPIAAAMAYGFDNTENEDWLVYDLGGGTFDVALISSKDGLLTVLAHNGNNFLGGKDFDWLIVEEIILPAILKNYTLTDFNRNNTNYQSMFARLKSIAETAKIELSQFDKTTIEVEMIGEDDNGKEIYVSVDFSRKEFEELIEPSIAETIKLSEKTLKESGVSTSAVGKIILVGGPTQIPFIKKSLEKKFGVKIDNSVDPLTVVAKGACIFGLSQRVPKEAKMSETDISKVAKEVTLHYDPVTSEDEETISGVVEGLEDSNNEYQIQIQSESGFYTSSKISLKKGKFIDDIAVEAGKENLYWIYLFDNKGNEVPVEPDSFTITQGLTVAGSPIPHSIGVIYAKKEFDSNFQLKEVCDVYFEKSSIPPLELTLSYKTIRKLLKGKDNQLPIKIYEGEANTPDRNDIISTLFVDGEKLPYDLPENTDVDITIKVDESRGVTIDAYIPAVELTLNARANIYAQRIDTKVLEQELVVQKEKLKSFEANLSAEEYEKLENTLDSISSDIKSAEIDEDNKKKAEHDLRSLKSQLDDVEKAKKIPQLKDEFEAGLESARELSKDLVDEDDAKKAMDQLDTLQKEGEKAIEKNDKDMLIRTNEQIQEIYFSSMLMNPAVWEWRLNEIRDSQDKFSDIESGKELLRKADEAVDSNNFFELKRCVRALLKLLPEDTQDEIGSNLSGITK